MLIDPPHVGRGKAAIKAALIVRYRLRNRFARTLVTGSCPAVVSLTSYGERIGIVAHAIESIAAGSVRPSRLILWLDEPHFEVGDQPMLARLVDRGLEIRVCEDLGPHKKYYPYCTEVGRDPAPLVTADDDILYPRRWLETLWAAHVETPKDFVGHRAVTISVAGEELTPYAVWPSTKSTQPSHRTFVTGGAGVVYPAALICALKQAGDAFRYAAPRADDVWINSVAARSGIRARWTGDRLSAWSFPRSQGTALHHDNVSGGGNDLQIARSYDPLTVVAVREDVDTS